MRILFIMTLLIAAACTGGTNDPATQREDITRSPGKPLHPIQVHAIVEDPLQAGVENGARLTVMSSRPAASVEVVLEPELATVISRNRFERHVSRTRRAIEPDGRPMDFSFRFRPASDAPQPVRVLVRVTGTDGRVLTRDVTLSLAGREKPGVREKTLQKRHDVEVQDSPEPAGDVIVPAQQEVRRGN